MKIPLTDEAKSIVDENTAVFFETGLARRYFEAQRRFAIDDSESANLSNNPSHTSFFNIRSDLASVAIGAETPIVFRSVDTSERPIEGDVGIEVYKLDSSGEPIPKSTVGLGTISLSEGEVVAVFPFEGLTDRDVITGYRRTLIQKSHGIELSSTYGVEIAPARPNRAS
jgi:hypothetical protein